MSELKFDDLDTTSRVNVVDKRIINGTTDVNQLVPFKYKWAWEQGLKSTYYLRTLSRSSVEKSTGNGGELNSVEQVVEI